MIFNFLPSLFVSASDTGKFEYTLGLDRFRNLNNMIEYLERVKHYETNVFKRTLTPEEKAKYCGYFLRK